MSDWKSRGFTNPDDADAYRQKVQKQFGFSNLDEYDKSMELSALKAALAGQGRYSGADRASRRGATSDNVFSGGGQGEYPWFTPDDEVSAYEGNLDYATDKWPQQLPAKIYRSDSPTAGNPSDADRAFTRANSSRQPDMQTILMNRFLDDPSEAARREIAIGADGQGVRPPWERVPRIKRGM
jgi:hypothetical protein